MSILLMLVAPGVVFYFMTPEERQRAFRKMSGLLRGLHDVGRTCRLTSDHPFYAELRARTRWPLVTYVLVAANVGMFALMLVSAGALGDPATLVGWGASFGPRTTDERWRVITSIFVHRSVVQMLVNVGALLQLGLIVERVVGPFTFGTIFFSAGVLASIMSAAAFPMGVVAGATGAVFGLYGLLLAAALRGLLQRTAVRLPVGVLLPVVPVAAVFGLYFLAAGDPSITAKVGLCTGVVGGIVLTRSIKDDGTRLRRFGVLGAATAAIVLMSAGSLRAVTDVRPEMAWVVANEERTAGTYDAAVARFREGHMNARELARTIDETIVPSMRRARERVRALADVPASDTSLVADAQEYLRLRDESWRIRAQGVRKGNMRTLRAADNAEQASLQVFERLKSELPK
jgi:rhomboid protease GluP